MGGSIHSARPVELGEEAWSRQAPPVVFVHGLWLHADCWSPWADLFREAGYAPVGHSFGGLVVQRLLGQNLAAAAVAIDPAPIRGTFYLPPSALRVASIALRNPANRNRAVALTRKQFRYGFVNAISEEESNDLYERWTIPSPGKPLFEDAFANLSRRSPAKVYTDNARRGPLLVTGGGQDHTVPAAVSRSTVKQYRKSPAVTDYKEFPDRGHTLALDSGWREVADTALNWLKTHSLDSGR